MRPTTAHAGIRPDHNIFDFNALLHPDKVFRHPRDVVNSTDLTLGEKRAILASWASDAAAVASCPGLRAPSGLSAPVTIDEILKALRELGRRPPASARWQGPAHRLHVTGNGSVREAEMNLPQQVVDNLERQWAAKLEQDVEAWKKRKRPRCRQQQCRKDRPKRHAPVRARSIAHSRASDRSRPPARFPTEVGSRSFLRGPVHEACD